MTSAHPTNEPVPLLERYRQAMTQIGAGDEVALVDHRVEMLWGQAVGYADHVLDEQAYASLPVTITPDLSAPADLDITAHLDGVERRIHGEPPEVTEPSKWESPRWFGSCWLGACVGVAVLLGLTVSGLTVIPAIVPAICTGLLLLVTGPVRAPGWVWSIGLLPLVLLLSSGSPPSDHSPIHVPPQWFLGVIFVALVAGFARLVALAGKQRLQHLADRGRAISQAAEISDDRRPLEIELVLCTLGAASAGSDGSLILIPAIVALLRRRRWTCALAAVAGLIMLLVAFHDISSTFTPDWAHPLVLVAFVTHWVRALFSDAWKHRLTGTERLLSWTGRVAAAGYRSSQQAITGQLSSLAPRPETATTPSIVSSAPPKKKQYPKGQFGRYCNSCFGVTAHVSGGLSQPHCVQCGSHAAGGGHHDRNFPDYCSSCNSTTPHTKKGCVVCASR